MLELMRQARAASVILVEGEDDSEAWGQVQSTCECLRSGAEENRLLMGHELECKVRDLVALLETSLYELQLARALGGEDVSGQNALGRARHGIERKSSYLESAIRRQMATLMAPSVRTAHRAWS